MEIEKLKTEKCHLQHHPEMVVYFCRTQVLRQDAEWLANFLESQVLSGVSFKAGETIQIGWMVLKIMKDDSSTLTLEEPNFREIPIVFDRSVNNTLAHLRTQKDIFESLGLPVELQFPSIVQSAIVCNKHEDSGGFFMERARQGKNDSGWFIGCVDPHHNHNDTKCLKRVSLYEIACLREMIIPFLALPEETSIIYSPAHFEIKFRKKSLVPKDGSFLQNWITRKKNL